MIKSLPPKIKLPNYDLTVGFLPLTSKELEVDAEGDHQFNRYGEFDLGSYTITLLKTNPEFDPYSYMLFLTAALIFCQDIKLSVSKTNILAFFLYYLFKHNNIKTYCTAVKRDKDMNFDVNLPGFVVNVDISSEHKNSPGCLSIPDGTIKINRDVSSRVKTVIFIHELVEWVNAMFVLGMTHHTIQSFSELLVFVIVNNNLVS